MSGASQINYTCELGTTDIDIADVQYIDELNQILKFSILVANHTINRATVAANIGNTVHVYRDGVEIVTGRIDVDKIVYSESLIEISGYVLYIDLLFEFFSKDQSQYDIRRVEYTNIAANTILSDVLTGTGYTTSECPSGLISLRGEYEYKIQWISAIAKACKWDSGGKTYSCDWWIDSANAVHIAQQRGSAKGVLNASILERELDYSNIENTAYGLGYGDGINQLKTVKSNTSSVTDHSAREVLRVDRRYTVQASIDDEMQEHADLHADPVEAVNCEISTYDYYALSLAPGDTVTLENDGAGVSGSYRIKAARVGVMMTSLEITNITDTISANIQGLSRQIRIDGSYMQGQTVPLNFSNMDNIESGYPLKLNCHIPAKTKAINAFYLSFDIELYRAFVAATANESAHTHAVTIAAHTHGLNMWPYSAADDLYIMGTQTVSGDDRIATNAAGPGLTTSLSGGGSTPTSAAGSSHTHAPGFGIMEDTDNSPSISLLIDSVDRTNAMGGPWAADQLELDITAYIQTVGKHTIELRTDQRCRIQADAWAQIFIQSD